MTPKQKREHIKSLEDMICSFGFKTDKYGNYRYNDFRIKIMKNNLRFEKKRDLIWFNILSKPIVNISVDTLSTYINKRISRTPEKMNDDI